ncbi:NIL domain-containing protein [Elusimicrobiota bacterium]
MDKKRLVLRFPKEIVENPVICNLAKEYQLIFSILKATVNPDTEGIMLIELGGDAKDIKKGIDYLKKNKVIIEELEKDIKMNDEKCTACGACLTVCPTRALYMDNETKKVIFDSEKCIACEFCLTGCPYRAMEVHF